MSALTPEGKVKRKVVEVLKKHEVWYFFPANNGFGKSGIPDIIAIVDGHFVGIEVKSATGKPTELQKICGKQIEEAGGTWLVVSNDVTLEVLDAVIQNRKDR
jgi:Holliday junction resolvase